MLDVKIADYMTPAPYTIGYEQSIAAAMRLMDTHKIRHLPVLDGGEIVGMVSERDIALVEALQDFDPEKMPIDEAVAGRPYVVGPDALLLDVVRHMGERKIGSAIIAEDVTVRGVFTATDALLILADFLSAGRVVARQEEGSAGQIRKRILDDHKHLRQMVTELQRLSDQTDTGDMAAFDELCVGARALYGALTRHMNMEERILLPALAQSEHGEEKVRHYMREHSLQRVALASALEDLALMTPDPPACADRIRAFLADIIADMDEEEQAFLP